jgi:hypothetical protein
MPRVSHQLFRCAKGGHFIPEFFADGQQSPDDLGVGDVPAIPGEEELNALRCGSVSRYTLRFTLRVH